MGVVKLQRTVEKYVPVAQCDGPECHVEVMLEHEYDTAPYGWITVHGAQAVGGPASGREGAIFHSWRCLLAWTQLASDAWDAKHSMPHFPGPKPRDEEDTGADQEGRRAEGSATGRGGWAGDGA